MTQLDLPPISFQRYLDLLKRRRWQVIPVSLLGLLVGGLVAMLIPRYYVAETVISYSPAPGSQAEGALEDPLVQLVETAKATLPFAVGETAAAIGWEGYAAMDPQRQQEFERELRTQIEVFDQNPGQQRRYAQLRITYRDLDGPRSAAFLNRLVEIWKTRQLQAMRDNAAAALASANDRADGAVRTFDAASNEVRNLEQYHNLQPGLSPQDEALLKQEAERARAALQKDLDEAHGRVLTLEAERKALQGEFERTERTQRPGDMPILPDGDPRVAKLVAEIAAVEKNLKGILPGHTAYRMREYQLQQLREELRKLLGDTGGTAEGELPNPRWLQLQRDVQQKEAELLGAIATRDLLQARLDEKAQKQQVLAGVYHDYRRLMEWLKEATENRQAAQREVERRTQILGALTNERPIDVKAPAVVPKRPTEPNVMVVAFLGCAIGLGTAIGLVLLLDLLQGTFKTIDDVGRGLGLPVLGGMAHLQTEERRRQAVRSRRWAVAVAGTTVVLVVAVLTIYYVDPIRLPPLVRDILSLVLGG